MRNPVGPLESPKAVVPQPVMRADVPAATVELAKGNVWMVPGLRVTGLAS